MAEVTSEDDGRIICVKCNNTRGAMYYALAAEGYLCTVCFSERIVKQSITDPDHYRRHPSGIECIEVTEHMTFNLGNAIKYIWRVDLKGKPIEDLEKAIWYINREIARRDTVKQ